MLFSSPIFLFLFLPLTLLAYCVSPRWLKNLVLLAASLLFYAWGEPIFVLGMIGSITFNYLMGLAIARRLGSRGSTWALAIAVAGNLAFLGYYKYAGFFLDNLSSLLTFWGGDALSYRHIMLPVGISFFTFQTMSYLIDVYRGQTPVQKNPLHLALYVTLFPQLVAGPIVRYSDVAEQIVRRRVTLDGFSEGVSRFIIGLAKKVLLADTLAAAADGAFSVPGDELGISLAWLGIACYTLQVYFDFSGYSDMAIGLGRMFGFRFEENFNYPYVSRSVTELWTRWHISLSTWFRDYLYIPLGGNRVAPWRVHFNLLTVFFLCGLWHGPSWNYVCWGLFQGLFLVLERHGFGGLVKAAPRPLQHFYAMAVFMAGLVIFRTENLAHSAQYAAALVGWNGAGAAQYGVDLFLHAGLMLALVVGVVASQPIVPWLKGRLEHWQSRLVRAPWRTSPRWFLERAATALAPYGAATAQTAMLGASMIVVSASTYSPFIYFRF